MNDDLISRQAAIAFLQSIPYIKEHPNMGELMKEWIEQMPSVQPKTGRWKIIGEETGSCNIRYMIYQCSECRWSSSLFIPREFCPNCGAKMESENKKA